MSKTNLFKLLFVAMFAFAATAFTSCSDDNDELTSAPVLEASPSTLTFTGEGGTQTIAITANCGWTVDTSSLEGWADVSPMSGEGNGTLTVTTYEAAASHTGVISFMLQHEYYGNWGKADATVTVKQNSGDVPPTPAGDALYEENCGTTSFKKADYNNNWPLVSAYEKWQRGGTLDQSGVTYGGDKSSVRCSGADYDDNTVSGAPYIVVKTLEISNINIASNTNFTLQFVAQNTVATSQDSPYTPTFGEISASSFKLEVGVNGAWYTVPFSVSSLGGAASWYTCVAPFKLTADMSTSTLAIRMSGFTGGTTLRVDDLKLFEGGDGAELGGGETPDPGKEGTISGITGTGAYTVSEAVVAATYKSGFLMEDETGVILVYQYADGSEFKVPAVGTKVSVSGNVTTYGGMLQFGSEGLQITENGTASIQKRTPVELDGPAADALKNATKPSYIKYSGALSVSGTYYNVAIPGATIIGSLQYPNDDLNTASFDGKTVDVVGWHVGCASNGKFLNTMVVTLAGEGETPDPGPEPEPMDGFTIDLSKQGFANNTSQDGKSITEGGYTLTFAKGTGGSNPSWFDNGSSFRLYAGNTLTVTGKSLKGIKLVFADKEYDYNKITTDVPTYTEPKWTGEAASVTFTVDDVRGEQSTEAGKTGGNRRIVKVIIQGEGAGDEPAPAEPKVTTAAYQNLTAESVTLGGSFEGFTAAPAEVGVEYLILTTGTAALANWDAATKVKAASAVSPFTVEVSGLAAETQYAYRAYAGDVYGDPMTFVTPASGQVETYDQIASITAAGNYTVKATVVGVNKVSYILHDDTGNILVYQTPKVSVGDVVVVSGEVEIRYDLPQFKSSATVTAIEKVSYTQPAPKPYTAAEIDAYGSNKNYDYVSVKGLLSSSVNGSFTNFAITVDGTSHKVNIYRPTAEAEPELKALDGKSVVVTGYLVGSTSAGDPNLMPITWAADGSVTPGPVEPDPVDPTGNSVALTAADIAKIGTSYADFSLTAADGSVWSGFAMSNSGFLQLGWNTNTTRTASKCYVLTPEVSGNITTITIIPDSANKTYNDRVFAALPVDFEYTGQSADEVKTAAYAYTANTVQGSTEPLTIDLKGKGLKQVIIRAVDGACYVDNITVEYE